MVIMDTEGEGGIGPDEYTKLCSSDYGYPYRPELIINYTPPPSTTYGNRPFQYITISTINCGGFALNVDSFLGLGEFGMDEEYMEGLDEDYPEMNESEILQLQLEYQAHCVEVYMTSNSIPWRRLSSYNSSINISTEYRIALRVKRVWSEDYPPELILDYHFWYQTNTGEWAEKRGGNPSRVVPNTSGATNPSSVSWVGGYNSDVIYYAINNY